MVGLVDAIKAKKEFSPLDDTFVTEKLETYLKEHPVTAKKLDDRNPKSATYKQVVKEVRAGLREVYGVFQRTSMAQRRKLLQTLGTAKGKGQRLAALDKLLTSHQSTYERRKSYGKLYKKLFSDKPAVILDLGCGMNPLAYPFLGYEPEYLCCDVSEEEIAFLNNYFEQEDINGRAFQLDLLKDRSVLREVRADVALLLKLVDTLETQQRNVTKKILTELFTTGTKKIIVSFPLVSIGGKKRRGEQKENWFSRHLKEKEYSWDTFIEADEEIWIVIPS